MKKKKILLLIPLITVAGFLIYCWATILTTDIVANWRHYTALILFLILLYLYFRNFKLAAIGTSIYLLLGTFNFLSITAEINTTWFNIGPVKTPPFQLLSLGILLLFLILNFDTLVDIYIDYKDS